MSNPNALALSAVTDAVDRLRRTPLDPSVAHEVTATLEHADDRGRLLLVPSVFEALEQNDTIGLHVAAVLVKQIPVKFRPEFLQELTDALVGASDEHLWLSDVLIDGFGADLVNAAVRRLPVPVAGELAQRAPRFLTRTMAQSDPAARRPMDWERADRSRTDPEGSVGAVIAALEPGAPNEQRRVLGEAKLLDASPELTLTMLDLLASTQPALAGEVSALLLGHAPAAQEAIVEWRKQNADLLSALEPAHRPSAPARGFGAAFGR